MKNLRVAGLGLAMMLCCAVSAQEKLPLNEPDYNKPLLFSNLPDKIPVEVAYLKNLLSNDLGKEVQLRLAGPAGLSFDGKVISLAGKETGASSVVVRSSNFTGANLTISEVMNEDGSVLYRGRIISFQHGDLLELQQKDGQYFFVKRNFYDLINE